MGHTKWVSNGLALSIVPSPVDRSWLDYQKCFSLGMALLILVLKRAYFSIGVISIIVHENFAEVYLAAAVEFL